VMGTARTEEPPSTPWADLTWHAVEGKGRRWHERLDRATTHTAWRTVNNLQKLLVPATSTRLLALRRLTQDTQGNHTAGMDGMVYATPEARWRVWQEGLRLQGDKPRPVRRVSIPQDHGQQSPLGLPTGKDRVRQASVKAALEPAWEARCEAHAYGFRPGRCTMEAMEAIPVTLSHKHRRAWVLDADSSGCFDHMDPGPLLATLPVFTATWRRWLHAGVVALGGFSPTDTGTPQGGVRSPLLATVAWDGMERLGEAEGPEGQPTAPSSRTGRHTGRAVIRDAEDCVITAPPRDVVET
jgi:RNA-directed DNA polymerase